MGWLEFLLYENALEYLFQFLTAVQRLVEILNKISVTIHLKLSIIYGLSIPKAPNIYLTTKLQCKPRKVYRTVYFVVEGES